MKEFRKINLAEELIETMNSVQLIDLLFKQDQKKPFVFRNNGKILYSLLVVLIFLAILITNSIFPFSIPSKPYTLDANNIYFIACTFSLSAVMIIIGMVCFSYLESLPVKKQMQKSEIPTPKILFNFRYSSVLKQMLLFEKYKTCLSKKLLKDGEKGCELINYYIMTIEQIRKAEGTSFQPIILTRTTIITLFMSLVSAFLAGVWAIALTPGTDLKLAAIVSGYIFLIFFTLAILIEYILLLIRLLMKDKDKETQQICKDLRLIQLYIASGLFSNEDETSPSGANKPKRKLKRPSLKKS